MFFNVRSSSELTRRQITFLKYCEFYSSIYEMDDIQRPSDDVIRDDKEVDYWFEEFRLRSNEKLKKYYNSIGEKVSGIDKKPTVVIGDE